MRYRSLGDGGPEVSVVGLGSNQFGGRVDEAGTRRIIDAALESGITLVDTADVYGNRGGSEAFIGAALVGRRDGVVLATKFGNPMFDDEDAPCGSRPYIRRAVEASLRRLRTDWIDLYQYHHHDGVTPLEETLGALNELVEEGTVRYVGSSNLTAAQVEDGDRIARERGWARFVSAQNKYSLVSRGVEHDLLPTCLRLGIGILPYHPLEQGLLTGKYRRDGGVPSRPRLVGPPQPLRTDAWDEIEALERYGRERGRTLLEVAVAGLAVQPTIGSVIAGVTTPEQVRANAAAGEWEPTPDDVAALRRVLEA